MENGMGGFGGDGSGENYDATRYQNNLEENPQFTNPPESNYNLLVSSPAINQGIFDTTGYNLPDFDLNGDPRISAYLLDQGCYENQDFVAPHQNLTIVAGWSGISSYILPYFPELEKLLEPLEGNLVILKNMEGVYWPGQNVNTLGNWETDKGYLVKLSQSTEFQIPGNTTENHTINLQAGWNLVPVLCSCGISTSEVSDQLGENLVIITEPAGMNVYWPTQGIQTLQHLLAGKSYFVRVNEGTAINFNGK